MASGLNQSHIRDIVAQVKSGTKSKTEAFNELKGILQTSTRKPETEVSGGAPETDSSASRFSQEDRRVLINKLIEKKRQGRGGSDMVDMGKDLSYSHDGQRMEQLRASGRTKRPSPTRRSNTPRGRSSSNSRSGSTSRSRSIDNFERAETRINRIARTEAAVREEMFGDFTFKPEIKKLPPSYGAPKDKDLPFHDRVMKWQREREMESSRRKELSESSELVDCTFRPRINRASIKAVKEIRGDTSENDANERLYKTQDMLQQQRTKYIEDQLRLERESEEQECTFQPQLSTKKNFSYVQSRFNKPGVDRSIIDETQKTGVKDCTFTPKVRGVGRSMSAAKLYCQSNVVDRLTRPFTATPADSVDDPMRTFDNASFGDRPIMNVSTFMSNLNNSSYQTPGRRRSSSAPRERTGGDASTIDTDSKEQRQRAFKEFMNRQVHTAEKKSQHIANLERSLKPKFTPKLCKRSVTLSEGYTKAEFFDRLERDLNRRAELENKLSVSVDNRCTFTPGINAKSKNLKPRSSYELSKGDSQRRENKHRQIRLKTEQESLQGMTFQPEITKRARSTGKSRLQLNSDSSLFLEKYKLDQEQATENRIKQLNDRRMSELDGCTFTPKTRECPSYVKRIAKSMAIVRSARAEANPVKNSRPQWK